jgi:regulatory protein
MNDGPAGSSRRRARGYGSDGNGIRAMNDGGPGYGVVEDAGKSGLADGGGPGYGVVEDAGGSGLADGGGPGYGAVDGSGGYGPVDGGGPGYGVAEDGGGGYGTGRKGRRGRRRQQPEDDKPADPTSEARNICLRLLTSAPRTQAQLAAALRKRGIPGDVAEAVLGRFAEVKLIDDTAFAAAWVESRHHGRGLARRALAAELRQRGVARTDIQAAVQSLSPEQEAETARALAAHRLAATRGLPTETRVRRLTGLLARKGYPAGLAYQVVREALEQEGVDPAAAGIDLDDPGDADLG